MQLTVILFCSLFAATRAIGNRYEEVLGRHLRTERIPNTHEAKYHTNMTNLRSISCSSPVALGMENNNIPDSAITASSWLKDQRDFYGPQFARLNFYPLGPWIKRDDDTDSWIQVDLGDELSGTVTGLQTQGAGESAYSDKYVSAFKVRYGEVRCNLNYVKDSNGATKVFTATSSAVTTHTFSQSVQARIIRIEPTTCKEYCALRFELFGCTARTSCGSGWNDHLDACYFLNHEARVNFAEAKSACQSTYGGKIASIHSKDEQSFIGGDPECYTDSFFGGDYRGFVSVTKDGTTCMIWSPQTPKGWTPENYPTSGLNENYCRNPSADDDDRPWCYTSPSGDWGYCDVGTAKQFCPTGLVKQDPNNDNHGYFVGLSDQTTEGVFQWADGSPLDYTNWQTGEPNGGFDDCAAIWPHGDGKWRDYKCRDKYAYICKTVKGAASCPSGFEVEDFQGSCYLLNHDARVTYSQAKIECQNRGAKLASIHSLGEQQFLSGDIECYTQTDGSDYRGHVSTTDAGKTCQKWTSQTPHKHSRTPENFPNGGLGDHNYCRNPDGESGAWCYTTEDDEYWRWDWCKNTIGQKQDTCEVARIKKDAANVDDGYFIGLNDQAIAGTYVWTDGSTVDYSNWDSGEPDNSGSDQDCVALWPKGGSTWRDYECNTQFPYICEKRHELSLLGRSATQSSTYLGPAGRAIDGDTDAVFAGNSCAQTAAGSGAWWMVDNVFNQCIGTVAIYTRQDCCKEQLQGAIVRVGSNPDGNRNPACGSPITLGQINGNPIVEVTCNRRGRYISVSLSGNGPLTLCEVKAYFGVCSAGLDTSPLTTAVCSSPVALGMENGELTDALITSSSSFDGPAKYGRLGGRKCWQSHMSESTPWIQVDLFGTTSNAVSGLITQGHPDCRSCYVTSYCVQVGEDICSLEYIAGSDNEPKVFTANSDADTKVTNLFATTLKARYVRIYLTEWTGFPSFRFEVLGCRL